MGVEISDYQVTNLQSLTRLLEEGVKREYFPGAVATVLHRGETIFEQAVGWAMVRPEQRKCHCDTVFDLASLTKVVVTAPAVMMLLEEGRFRLDDPVAMYIPEFASDEGKERVTIRQLLTHTSGLPAWIQFYKSQEDGFYNDDALSQTLRHPLETPPGQGAVYSDLGYIILGHLVERVSGLSLDVFATQRIFQPLGMTDTRYGVAGEDQGRVAATEFCSHRDRVVCGEVHDENAASMGGVAGHAGLFGTARDLAIYGEALRLGGEYQGVRILSSSTVELMTSRQTGEDHGGGRGLGWVRFSRKLSAGGDLVSDEAYGHTGFTGTSLLIDPEKDLVCVVLTNRVHYGRDNHHILRFRTIFHNVAMAELT